jgi:hypothetical protein
MQQPLRFGDEFFNQFTRRQLAAKGSGLPSKHG